MWHRGLRGYLGYEQMQAYLRYIDENNTSFQQKLAFIRAQRDDGPGLAGRVVEWCAASCPYEQFQHRFVPVEEEDAFRCAGCGATYTRHVKLDPCEHRFCADCARAALEAQAAAPDVLCPACGRSVRQVTADLPTMQRQLRATVYCPHGDPTTVEFIYYAQTEVTPAHNPLGLSPETFAAQAYFNDAPDVPRAANVLRAQTLRRRAQPSADVQAQIDGRKRAVAFYAAEPVAKPVRLPPCVHACAYAALGAHLRDCPRAARACPHCGARYPRAVMERHLPNCRRRPVACPVCYLEDIPLEGYNAHAAACLGRLAALARRAGADAAYGQAPDVDLEIKVRALARAVDGLTAQALQMDSALQNELLAHYQQWAGPQAAAPRPRLLAAATELFGRRFPLYAVTESVAGTALQQLVFQLAPGALRAAGGAVFALQTAVFALFLVYARYFVKYQSFRHQTARFFVLSYFSLIVWFAGYFVSIEALTPGAIEVAGERVNRAMPPAKLFGYMVYYSALMGGQGGFGDVLPRNPLSKTAFVAHIYLAVYIKLIWFRGLSFMIKLAQINQVQRRGNTRRRRLGQLARADP